MFVYEEKMFRDNNIETRYHV